jgi:peptide/nickel transport system substrate-binding protein
MALALHPLTATAGADARSVVLNISQEPLSLDPTMEAAVTTAQVTHYNLFEGLTKIEENGSVTPLLATGWQRSSDGRNYTFQLRRGVHFHDGAPFDASAVRFSFERANAPGSTNKARKALFDNLAGIATPDPYTVVLTLRRADSHTLFRLGEATAVILHPDSADDAATRPVGTGPYRLGKWSRGHSITLEKVASYRQPDAAAIRQARFYFINDAVAQVEALESGRIDLFFNFATHHLHRFQNDTRYQVLIGSSSGKGMLALNNRRQPLNDVRVRRAITHAIDREAFISTVLEGRGTAIGSHFVPTDAGYIHLANMYPYNPAQARALLREAGVQAPLELTLTLPPTPYARAGGPVVAADLARVGIAVRLQPVEWAQWLSGAFRGQFDMTLINHAEPLDYRIYTDPNYYFGYDSAVFRALAERHAAASSARERQQLFAQLQRQLAIDAANAWIFAPQIGTVVRKGLQGVWMNYPIFVHDLAALRWE